MCMLIVCVGAAASLLLRTPSQKYTLAFIYKFRFAKLCAVASLFCNYVAKFTLAERFSGGVLRKTKASFCFQAGGFVACGRRLMGVALWKPTTFEKVDETFPLLDYWKVLSVVATPMFHEVKLGNKISDFVLFSLCLRCARRLLR